ncbi:MAG: acyltransferase [Rhodobacteraceae bacterium]|nr:acyltransferase [Paracoccaceae bacterium]
MQRHMPLNRSFYRKVADRLSRMLAYMLRGHTFGEFGSKSYVGKPFMLRGQSAIALGSNVSIWKMARLEVVRARADKIVIRIGDDTVIQPFVHISAVQSVEIGRECLFASGVYISDHDHVWQDPNISTLKKHELEIEPVSIGDGVWLGERVIVLKGVSIGEGSVVGAGSVVSKNIPKRCVAGGVPARILKQWNEITGEWEKA